MRTYTLIIVATIVALNAYSIVHAQTVQRAIPVSAAGAGTTASHTLRGTLGQTVIGRTKIGATIQSVGFWYRPRLGGTTVAMPATEGEIGTRVSIPVMLTHSKALVINGPRTFTIKLRYNRTVLVYEGPFTVIQDGNDNVVTITGNATDSVGVLAELSFLVTLGNAERTDLTLDEVAWGGSGAPATTVVNGTFQALGVCKEGDVVRLIRRKNTTAITGIAPQPARDIIDVDVLLGANGPMSLHVIDLTGATVATLVHDMNAKASLHKLTYDVSQLISGSYYLVLQTSGQLHTTSLIIRK